MSVWFGTLLIVSGLVAAAALIAALSVFLLSRGLSLVIDRLIAPSAGPKPQRSRSSRRPGSASALWDLSRTHAFPTT
jgi:hypothetical protein